MTINTVVLILMFSTFACQVKQDDKTHLKLSNLEKVELDITLEQISTLDTLQLIGGKIDYSKNKMFVFVEKSVYVSKPMFLDETVFEHFKKMQSKAKKEGVNLKIISGVRNFEDQKRIWERKWEDRKNIKDEKKRALDILKFSSMPMTSRHHWGTDIDINSLDNKYFTRGEGLKVYQWLVKNAHQFGFHQVYTNKKETIRTGYEEEKWHWSYLPKAEKYLNFYNDNISNKDIIGFFGSEQAQTVDMLKNYVNGISKP